jgi:hypothetical protein
MIQTRLAVKVTIYRLDIPNCLHKNPHDSLSISS